MALPSVAATATCRALQAIVTTSSALRGFNISEHIANTTAATNASSHEYVPVVDSPIIAILGGCAAIGVLVWVICRCEPHFRRQTLRIYFLNAATYVAFPENP